MNAEVHRQWRSPTRIALAALAALFFAMWIASYWTYTSLGIDRETLEPDGTVLNRYDRVRWPGDGSLWIGSGSWQEALDPARKLDSFDLGGTFFKPPRRPQTRSLWNRLGFWREPSSDAVTVDRAENWLGVPGWLPALVFGLLAVRWRGARVEGRERPSPPRS